MTRVIVCGSRKFDDKELLYKTLDDVLAELETVEIVSGHAQGADRLAEEYANERSLKLIVFPANWKRYGKVAGPIRNKGMLEYALQADPLVIAFWDGKGSGTKNMISLAEKAGTEMRIVNKEL